MGRYKSVKEPIARNSIHRKKKAAAVRKSTKVASDNRKVRNATPTTYNGIKFRSKLEVYMYKLLVENGIYAEYEKKSYKIVDSFEFNGEKVRPITIKPDFEGEDFIIEVKGYANESFPLRWKLFKKHLLDIGRKVTLYLPKNQSDCRDVVNAILIKLKRRTA